MTREESIKAQEDFTEYVNREVLSAVNWKRLKESYIAHDYGYMKELLKEMTENAREYLASFHPYDYFPTIQYPDDIHVDWDKCPADIREIIDYCRSESPEQTGGMKLT